MIKSRLFTISCILITALSCQPADKKHNLADPHPTEIRMAAKWLTKHFSRTENQLPFSFELGGKASSDLLKTWDFRKNSERTDGDRILHHLTWTDSASRFLVRCEVVEYHDFPTLEWTLWFTNQGTDDTDLLSNIQSLMTAFPMGPGAISVLRYINGDNDSPTSYALHTDTISAGKALRFAPPRGRPTRDAFPYYNLSLGDQGVIAVIGWPGQWASEFMQHTRDSVRIMAGQQNTSLKLKPGEEIRSPLVVLQFYKGDWIRSQNIWRRWMVKHNMPDYKGVPLKPMVSACNGNHYPGIITNAAEELKFMNRYLEEGIKPDFWWEDAGWYRCGNPPSWMNVGTWETDTTRWPLGIREVGDWCREKNIGTILWYEPERVTPGSEIANGHPEWIIRTTPTGGIPGGLLDMGKTECRAWLTDKIEASIRKNNVDVYRQDFNMNPLPYWTANDRPDRRGVTENFHIQGYLAFYDDLIKRFQGNLMIDNCAGGGGRLDIESLRRSVPLLRSDYLNDANSQQGHNYGLSLWLPFFGTGFLTIDEYLIRSSMCAEFTLAIDSRIQDAPYDILRKLLNEWREISPCYLGDFYPLTPYSNAPEVLMAWQYHLQDSAKGFIQSFRREACPISSISYRLQGLVPESLYEVLNHENAKREIFNGKYLMDKGLIIEHTTPGSSVLVSYFQVQK